VLNGTLVIVRGGIVVVVHSLELTLQLQFSLLGGLNLCSSRSELCLFFLCLSQGSLLLLLFLLFPELALPHLLLKRFQASLGLSLLSGKLVLFLFDLFSGGAWSA
jgi:hypothetical protein